MVQGTGGPKDECGRAAKRGVAHSCRDRPRPNMDGNEGRAADRAELPRANTPLGLGGGVPERLVGYRVV